MLAPDLYEERQRIHWLTVPIFPVRAHSHHLKVQVGRVLRRIACGANIADEFTLSERRTFIDVVTIVIQVRVVVHEAAGRIERIDGDVTELATFFSQFALNLISNGIKFRKKDTAPEITLTVNDMADAWEFTLQDNGIGIAEKDLPKLFQAFQRLHRREEYPGTGLGLVTCKKIVETHGGKIWISSEQGKGTTFYFTIKKFNSMISVKSEIAAA